MEPVKEVKVTFTRRYRFAGHKKADYFRPCLVRVLMLLLWRIAISTGRWTTALPFRCVMESGRMCRH